VDNRLGGLGMARRRARKLLISGVIAPADLGKSVVDKYVSEARTNVTNWSRSYVDRINTYIGDRTRQDLAKAKLGVWYDLFITEIYPRIKEVFATARSTYIKKVLKPLGGGVAPGVPI
jgi:hypothetical protein